MLLRIWLEGWRRVAAAPAIAAGVFLVTLALALPLAWTIRESLAAHLGNSLAGARAAEGEDYGWWDEFAGQAAGVGATFTPTILGFAATLDTISGVLDGQRQIAAIATVIGLYIGVWTFLAGGILDRYARRRPTRAHGFFGAAGGYFFRLIRLGLLAGVAYWWLFAYVREWLFDERLAGLTSDLTSERTAFLLRALCYAAFGLLLAGVNVLFDYAKVRLVVEDRRSAAGAAAAAWRFIRRHPSRVSGLYALNALSFGVLLAAWAVAAPGPTGSGASLWAGLALGQAYVLARLLLKLHFLASETALFQASLAHAGYTAAPERVWPESPAAEAVSSAPLR